jgi:hypothetical protein
MDFSRADLALIAASGEGNFDELFAVVGGHNSRYT